MTWMISRKVQFNSKWNQHVHLFQKEEKKKREKKKRTGHAILTMKKKKKKRTGHAILTIVQPFDHDLE